MNAIPLPTQFLYEFSIDQDLVDRSLEYFLNSELKSGKTNLKDDHSIDILMMNNPGDEFNTCVYQKELFAEIQKCIDQVATKHFKNTQLAICDSWITRGKFGQKCEPHHHSYSIFSGLLYMTDQERSETIFTLTDPFFSRLEYLFGPGMNEQPYKFTVKPKKGKLIIWDSSIKHKIGTVAEKNTRYTLAFNTWPTGLVSQIPSMKLKANLVDVAQLSQKD